MKKKANKHNKQTVMGGGRKTCGCVRLCAHWPVLIHVGFHVQGHWTHVCIHSWVEETQKHPQAYLSLPMAPDHKDRYHCVSICTFIHVSVYGCVCLPDSLALWFLITIVCQLVFVHRTVCVCLSVCVCVWDLAWKDLLGITVQAWLLRERDGDREMGLTQYTDEYKEVVSCQCWRCADWGWVPAWQMTQPPSGNTMVFLKLFWCLLKCFWKGFSQAILLIFDYSLPLRNLFQNAII